MDTVRVRPLRPSEQKKLHRMNRQKTNAVNRCHARILLLSRGGQRNRAIAERVDCSPQWVRTLIHRFNAQGLDGISWYPWMHADHRPRRFPADVLEQIAEVALSSPRALIGMTHWSLTKLRRSSGPGRSNGNRTWMSSSSSFGGRFGPTRTSVRAEPAKSWAVSRRARSVDGFSRCG